jgi:O-antigen ligase
MMEPATQHSQRQVPRSTSSGFEFYFLVVLLFVLYSRVFDFFPVPYIPMFAFLAALAVTAFSGRITQLFQPRISKLWVILTGWLAVSAALSIWRSGSWQTLVVWFKALSIYFVTIGLITTFDQCSRAVRTVAWSIGTLAVLSFIYGNTTNGRFFNDEGKFQGPNELAQVLLFGLPALWFLFSRGPRISVKRIVALGLILIVSDILLHTGSRGGMIAALVMYLIALTTARSKGMAVALLGGGLLILIGVLALSPSVRNRYVTFFDSGLDEGVSKQTAALAETATASANQRWQLFLDSLTMTLEHPIAGVGPGMFAEARERASHTGGTHVPFLLTHNTFTELSSEAGIPAALLYIMVVIASFRIASRIQRLAGAQPTPRMQEIAAVASALKLSLVAYGVSSLFISVAYQSLLPTVAGLLVALDHTVSGDFASMAPNRRLPPPSAAVTPFKQRVPITAYAPGLRSGRRA